MRTVYAQTKSTYVCMASNQMNKRVDVDNQVS